MILLHFVYSLWALLLIPLINAEEFTPKVTKTIAQDSFEILSFDDSNTLIRKQDTSVTISFDDGETWKKLKALKAKSLGYTSTPSIDMTEPLQRQ